MKKVLLTFLLSIIVSSQAHAWFWCDDYVSSVQVGLVHSNFGGGFANQCYIGESFFLPQSIQGTYESNAGINSFMLNFAIVGAGFDFAALFVDSSDIFENLHPYVAASLIGNFLITNGPNDSDLGFGYQAAAGANYRFDRFVLGAEFNHNFVNYIDLFPNDHFQSYLLTLGISF